MSMFFRCNRVSFLIIATDANGNSEIKPERAQKIAEQATRYYEKLGLCMKVQFFDESKNAFFLTSLGKTKFEAVFIVIFDIEKFYY